MRKVIDIYFGAKSENILSGGAYADFVTIAPHSGTINDIIDSLISSKSRWVAIRLENDNIQYLNVEKILWFKTRDMKEDSDKSEEELEKDKKNNETNHFLNSLFNSSLS